MFAKISRYLTLPDVVTTDARGRTVASKALRPLPTVSGTFLHTVEEVDRLEHLAFKYYQQSRNWWRICDANPEVMAPQALLGKEPVVTVRFPLALESEEAQPAWAALMGLAAMVGVERVQIVEEEVELVPQQRDIAGTRVTVVVPRYERAVIITYNQMHGVGTGDLIEIMAGEGFAVGAPELVGRVGKPIVIPSGVVG